MLDSFSLCAIIVDMNIQDAIKLHPNLMNNYRRAALSLVLVRDMAERGEYNARRDSHLVLAAHQLGKAQGWLHCRYQKTICGISFTNQLADNMRKTGRITI